MPAGLPNTVEASLAFEARPAKEVPWVLTLCSFSWKAPA